MTHYKKGIKKKIKKYPLDSEEFVNGFFKLFCFKKAIN